MQSSPWLSQVNVDRKKIVDVAQSRDTEPVLAHSWAQACLDSKRALILHSHSQVVIGIVGRSRKSFNLGRAVTRLLPLPLARMLSTLAILPYVLPQFKLCVEIFWKWHIMSMNLVQIFKPDAGVSHEAKVDLLLIGRELIKAMKNSSRAPWHATHQALERPTRWESVVPGNCSRWLPRQAARFGEYAKKMCRSLRVPIKFQTGVRAQAATMQWFKTWDARRTVTTAGRCLLKVVSHGKEGRLGWCLLEHSKTGPQNPDGSPVTGSQQTWAASSDYGSNQVRKKNCCEGWHWLE